jgi:hypothetical protein
MPTDSTRFVSPPNATRRVTAPSIPDAAPPPLDNQGDVVASAVPIDDDDLAALLPEVAVPAAAADGSTILIHILEDGFTAAGQVWYRGQEIEYIVGEQAFEDTKDRHGRSWLACDDATQMQRWGRVMFRRGPWPGASYDDPRAAAAELARGRRPKSLAGIAPPGRR